MEIPVYLFTGFLGSGKTSFIQTTLEDKRFNNGTPTLLLLCEDGEVELDVNKFANKTAIHIEPIESLGELTEDRLTELLKKHKARRVLAELNGMWMINDFLNAMPDGWMIYQEMSFADSTDYSVYNANMRNLVGDKLKNCDMIAFNRFTPAMEAKKAEFHKIVRGVSKKTQIIFDYGDHAEQDDIVDPLPFDVTKDVIEIKDNDYGIWYADLMDDEQKYNGKTMIFKGLVAMEGRMPPNTFVIGRHIMNCCANDVVYGGVVCRWTGVNALHHQDWITIKGKISIERHKLYRNGTGPVLDIISVAKATQPEQEVVTFI